MGSAPRFAPIPQDMNQLCGQVIEAAIKVHSKLGPGLLEATYRVCLVHELKQRGLRVEQEVAVPVVYEGVRLESGFRLDLLVEGKLVVELKAVDVLLAVHKAQVLSYLRLTQHRVGLLLNFNVALLKHGIRRIVNN